MSCGVIDAAQTRTTRPPLPSLLWPLHMRCFPHFASSVAAAVVAACTLAPLSLSAQIVWPDEGPRTWAPRPTQAAITADDLRTRLYQFADDSMMGREVGTLGNVKGTDYIAAEFKRLGLIPAGENGSYFQNLDYGRVAYNQERVRLSVAGTTLAASVDWAPAAPSAGGRIAGTANWASAPTVYGGRFGDTATVLNPSVVQGRVVVFSEPAAAAPGAPRAEGNPLAAHDAGAIGMLIISESISPAAFRERVAVRPSVEGNVAAASVTAGAAQKIFGKPVSDLSVGATGQPVSGTWTYELTPLEYPTRNVLAILPGADEKLKGQYVIIGAHSDHVGMVRGPAPEHDSLRAFNTVLRPQGANDRVAINSVTEAQWAEVNALIAKARAIRGPRLDTVNNGADDDGSGTVVMLEIAERMATGPRPARSILFNSHAGEEKGLLGSAWWAENPTVPLDSVVVAHNMDMLGKGRVTDVRFGGPHTVQMLGSRRVSLEFGDMIDSLNAVRDEPMVIDYSWDRTNRLNRFCRSDQVSYIRKGIPTTYFSTGYSRDYHQATDEPQYINYDLSARVARFVHDIALTAANRPERLQVLPRDQQDPAARCGG